MKEINLIVTQGQLQKSRARELAKDKKHNKSNVLVAGALIGVAIIFLVIGMNLKNTGYTNCINNGYSKAYCLKNS